ncbi:DUF1196 domain-containing protein, partial [Vibrio cholerae]|nr:DUF1196 domain-containing protein [Vibrio cholerae]
ALTVPLEAFVMCVLLTANRDKALQCLMNTETAYSLSTTILANSTMPFQVTSLFPHQKI